MRKMLLGLVALMTATAGQAAIQIGFNSPSGDLGSNTHTYTNGSLSVTATGYSNYNFGTNTGTATDLYGKNSGGDESGVGLVGDPSGDHEIWYDFGRTTPTIILDVSSLFGLVTSAQFEMGSTTAGEQWILGGWNGTSWVGLLTGTTEGSFVNLPGWGTYSKYAFLSNGTVTNETHTSGNVLLAALSVTAVPEPATWGMMLVGFAGIGLAMRGRRRQRTIPQLA